MVSVGNDKSANDSSPSGSKTPDQGFAHPDDVVKIQKPSERQGGVEDGKKPKAGDKRKSGEDPSS